MTDQNQATRAASCSCGQLRVTCTGEPVRTSICHCLECQKRTGAPFGAQARFDRSQVSTEGAVTEFSRTGDEGNRVTFRFCPTCGSTVYWTLSSLPDIVAVALGNFDKRDLPVPRISVYESRRHPWVVVPDHPEMQHFD